MKNWMVQSQKFLVNFLCGVILAYQKTFSPDHGPLGKFTRMPHCRFFPSCSVYATQALRQSGLLRGFVASCKRILRCNPWSRGGYDPVC